MSLFIFPPIFLDITVLHFKVRLWPAAVPKHIFILMNASHIYIIYLLESTFFNGSSYTSPKSLGCSIKMFVYSPGEFLYKKQLPPSFLQSHFCENHQPWTQVFFGSILPWSGPSAVDLPVGWPVWYMEKMMEKMLVLNGRHVHHLIWWRSGAEFVSCYICWLWPCPTTKSDMDSVRDSQFCKFAL